MPLQYAIRVKRLIHQFFMMEPAEIRGLLRRHAFLFSRFLYILGREAKHDQIWQRASALTYTSILTLFPLIVLLTSMGSIFYTKEQETDLIEFIQHRFLPPTSAGLLNPTEQMQRDKRAEEIESLTSTIRQMSDKYRESAPRVGLLGFFALLFTSYILYHSIENAFDAAWSVGKERASFKRSISGFAFLVVFTPLLIGGSIAASSMLLHFAGQTEPVPKAEAAPEAKPEGDLAAQASTAVIDVVTQSPAEAAGVETPTNAADPSATDAASKPPEALPAAPNPPPAKPPSKPVSFLLSLLPFFLNSLMLSLAYALIPRAKVRPQYALLGGFVAGLLWELAKVGFFYYIFLSAQRRQMLRTLGAIPIFIIWIYFTWIVFLLGNHIVYASQNMVKLHRQYFGRRSATILDGHVFVTVGLIVADSFTRAENGVRYEELAAKMRISFSQLDQVLMLMKERGYLATTAEGRIVPARPPEHIAVRDLLELGCDPRLLCIASEWEARPRVGAALQHMVTRRDRLLKGRTLADLLGPGPQRLDPNSSRVDLNSIPAADFDRLEKPEDSERIQVTEDGKAAGS